MSIKIGDEGIKDIKVQDNLVKNVYISGKQIYPDRVRTQKTVTKSFTVTNDRKVHFYTPNLTYASFGITEDDIPISVNVSVNSPGETLQNICVPTKDWTGNGYTSYAPINCEPKINLGAYSSSSGTIKITTTASSVNDFMTFNGNLPFSFQVYTKTDGSNSTSATFTLTLTYMGY